MKERVTEAAVQGLVLGVKYGIALLIIAVALILLTGDYQVVRQRSMNGELAFEFIQRQQESKPQTQSTPPAGTKPDQSWHLEK